MIEQGRRREILERLRRLQHPHDEALTTEAPLGRIYRRPPLREPVEVLPCPRCGTQPALVYPAEQDVDSTFSQRALCLDCSTVYEIGSGSNFTPVSYGLL